MASSSVSKLDGLTPIVTFVSMIVLGVVISQFIVTDTSLQLPIILGSFALGILLAALEIRAIIGRKRIEDRAEKQSKMTDEERQHKLARYVADLFEEDIPFDEMEAEKQRKLDEMMGRTPEVDELDNDTISTSDTSDEARVSE